MRYTSGTQGELQDWANRDLLDALSWAVQQELVDGDRSCIYGERYGAYAASVAMARNEGANINCAVGVGGVYDLSDGTSLRNPPITSPHYLLSGFDPNTATRKYTAEEVAQRISGSVMLVHGQQDQQVPVEQSQRMYELLQKAPVRAKLMLLPEQPQPNLSVESRLARLTSILEFLQSEIDGSETSSQAATTQSSRASQQTKLTPEQLDAMKEIVALVNRDIRRLTRTRDSKNLPTGVRAKPRNASDMLRLVNRALNGRDKQMRKVIPEEQWAEYEALKQRYAQQSEQALSRGRSLPTFQLSSSG